MGDVFLDISAGDVQAFESQTAGYTRAKEFLATVYSSYALPEKIEDLDEEQLLLLQEMYDSNPTWSDRGPIAVAPPTPIHVGRLIIQLDDKKTPKTASNFRSLCTGEKGIAKGTDKAMHYKGCNFHRILDNLIHGGDFTRGDGSGGVSIYGKKFKDEAPGLQKKHTGPGIVGMANSGKNSNNSQFYITFEATPKLDGKHVVFGSVKEDCLPVLQEIQIRCKDSKNPNFKVTITDCGLVNA